MKYFKDFIVLVSTENEYKVKIKIKKMKII